MAASHHVLTCDTFPLCPFKARFPRALAIHRYRTHSNYHSDHGPSPAQASILFKHTKRGQMHSEPVNQVWPDTHSQPYPKLPPVERDKLRDDEVWPPALSKSPEKPLRQPRVKKGTHVLLAQKKSKVCQPEECESLTQTR